MSAVPSASATISAGDQFTSPRQFAGAFLVRVTSSPGSNVVRIQCASSESGTYQNATDLDGVAYGLTAAGTYPVDNPSSSLWWRVGVPTADYASGSVTVEASGK